MCALLNRCVFVGECYIVSRRMSPRRGPRSPTLKNFPVRRGRAVRSLIEFFFSQCFFLLFQQVFPHFSFSGERPVSPRKTSILRFKDPRRLAAGKRFTLKLR